MVLSQREVKEGVSTLKGSSETECLVAQRSCATESNGAEERAEVSACCREVHLLYCNTLLNRNEASLG